MTIAYVSSDKLAKLETMLIACFTSQTHAQQDSVGMNSMNSGQAVIKGDMRLQILSICIIIPVRISHLPWPFFCHHLLLGNRLGMTSEIGFESLVLSL